MLRSQATQWSWAGMGSHVPVIFSVLARYYWLPLDEVYILHRKIRGKLNDSYGHCFLHNCDTNGLRLHWPIIMCMTSILLFILDQESNLAHSAPTVLTKVTSWSVRWRKFANIFLYATDSKGFTTFRSIIEIKQRRKPEFCTDLKLLCTTLRDKQSPVYFELQNE